MVLSGAMSARLQISALAARCGVSVHTVRFYEREGLLPPPTRTASGHRTYDQATVERLRLIRRLQEVGLRLDDIRGILARLSSSVATLRRWLVERASYRLEERKKEARALQIRRRGLARVLKQCRKRERWESVSSLLESFLT